MKRILIMTLCFVYVTFTNAQELDKSKALNLIQQNAAVLKISVGGDDLPMIANAYTDPDLGLTYIYIQQNYKHINVFNAIITTVFKQHILQSNLGDFVTNITSKANNETPAITATKAVTLAAKHLNLTDLKNLYEIENTFTINKKIIFSPAAIGKNNIATELVWVYNEDKKTVKLAWNVSIDVLNSNDYWNVRIDAATGDFIEKNNYTVYENHNTIPLKKVVQKKSITTENIKSNVNKTIVDDQVLTAATTTATYNVIPYPKESYLYSNPALETNPWLKASAGNTAAITHGWHYDGFTDYDITRGNNVYAYDDSLAQNYPGRYPTSTTASPTLTFNSTFTKTKLPYTSANREFATTNLFYWNNIMHDISYQYGFTEAAGNFQSDNMGRGGQENDYVNAEAQDGGGTNNANFSTPQDGSNPRMQMYIFTYTTPKRDGDLDNAVISHEYTHGISTRLTGGPANSSCLYNYEQGGEGWSDYVALMVTTNWATAKITDGTKSRSVGNYLKGQSNTGFGFRTFPYSTDMTVNFHTYADVSNNGAYPQYNNNVIIPDATEVHYIGEVWCSALWDMTWNIIQQVGYVTPNLYDTSGKGGNIIALKLVIQGLKFQKCSPGFLDARNAILKADSVLYDNLYHAAIWDAFARRGMGYTAKQGLSTKTTDQVDAYDAPVFSIDGRFTTPTLKPIPNTLLWEKKNNFYWRLTDSAAGYYQLNAYRNGVRTYFGAKKNESIKNNGVSSIDVILTQNHILNKIKLNSPYKIIAADVNNDKNVSSIDIIFMKRLILGIDTSFKGNRLWAFVDSAYKFPDTTNPFPYKDSISFTNLTANQTNQTFIGVKLGDVNYDWNPTQGRGVINNNVELIIDNEAIKVNKKSSTVNYQLPVKVKNFKNLVAMQFTLHFNHNLYDFIGIENNTLGIEFNKEQANKTGNISFLWTSTTSMEKTLDEGIEIFSLLLKRKWETGNMELDSRNWELRISNDMTEIEAWDKNFQHHNITLTQKETTAAKAITINNWTVSPNPNDGNIVINLNSNSNKKIQFELTNTVGKPLYTQNFEVTKGNNSFSLSLNTKSKLPSGVYFMKLIGLAENNVKRIVIN